MQPHLSCCVLPGVWEQHPDKELGQEGGAGVLESTCAPHLGSVQALGKGTSKLQSFGENASTEQSMGLGQRLFRGK